MKKMLVTGSSGLIGSEVVAYFCQAGWEVHGVANNMRADFFGPGGDTRWNQQRLLSTLSGFRHHELDIRDRHGVNGLLASLQLAQNEGALSRLGHHQIAGRHLPRNLRSFDQSRTPHRHHLAPCPGTTNTL